MTNLKNRFHTSVRKLNHQITHLLQVVDFLLQEDLDSAYDIINDRLHFLQKCEHKSLEEAAIYYEELRGDTDKDHKFRNAEVTAAMKVKRPQGRGAGGGRFTTEEHNWFNNRRGQSQETSDQSRQRAHSITPTSSSTNPFVDQGGGHGQGGAGGGRRSRRQWRRNGRR